jgi:hypothetical protein
MKIDFFRKIEEWPCFSARIHPIELKLSSPDRRKCLGCLLFLFENMMYCWFLPESTKIQDNHLFVFQSNTSQFYSLTISNKLSVVLFSKHLQNSENNSKRIGSNSIQGHLYHYELLMESIKRRLMFIFVACF